MAFYDQYNYRSYWQGREYEHQAEIKALKKLFAQIPHKKTKTLVDIGCGFGRLAPLYNQLFASCFLVEPSAKLLNQAKRKLAKCPNLDFKQGSWEKLNLPQKVDVALVVRVAHHIQDIDLAIKNISQHLNEDGFLILEFANKINFKIRLKMFFCGRLDFCHNLDPCDRRSPGNINEETIIFLNHHPQKIIQALEKNGLKVIDKLSVSNFRWPILKKIIPTKILLAAEEKLQRPLAKIDFGPSIFILAKKKR
jgi:ubiquinone/menaquinone biosynthesis C-methylase UbiE